MGRLRVKPCPNRKCFITKHDQTFFGDYTIFMLEHLVWSCFIKFQHWQTFDQTHFAHLDADQIYLILFSHSVQQFGDDCLANICYWTGLITIEYLHHSFLAFGLAVFLYVIFCFETLHWRRTGPKTSAKWWTFLTLFQVRFIVSNYL